MIQSESKWTSLRSIHQNNNNFNMNYTSVPNNEACGFGHVHPYSMMPSPYSIMPNMIPNMMPNTPLIYSNPGHGQSAPMYINAGVAADRPGIHGASYNNFYDDRDKITPNVVLGEYCANSHKDFYGNCGLEGRLLKLAGLLNFPKCGDILNIPYHLDTRKRQLLSTGLAAEVEGKLILNSTIMSLIMSKFIDSLPSSAKNMMTQRAAQTYADDIKPVILMLKSQFGRDVCLEEPLKAERRV